MTTSITSSPMFCLVGKKFGVSGETDAAGVMVFREAGDDTVIIGSAEVADGKWNAKECILVDSGYPAKIFAGQWAPGGGEATGTSKKHDVYAIGHYELVAMAFIIGVIIQRKKHIWKG